MTKPKSDRAKYTLEFKQEAVRLLETGQTIAGAARSLGVSDQTLFNWEADFQPVLHASSPANSA
jgi:transposase-like protein